MKGKGPVKPSRECPRAFGLTRNGCCLSRTRTCRRLRQGVKQAAAKFSSDWSFAAADFRLSEKLVLVGHGEPQPFPPFLPTSTKIKLVIHIR